MEMTKILSFFVCIIIILGLYFRKERTKHISLMVTAFVVDMGLVLYIEMTRQAIDTAMHPTHPYVIFHVIISVAVVVMYLWQIIIGLRLLKLNKNVSLHRWGGLTFFVLRLANFFTSLWIEEYVNH